MGSVCLEGGRTPDTLIKDRAERNIKALKKSTGGGGGKWHVQLDSNGREIASDCLQ